MSAATAEAATESPNRTVAGRGIRMHEGDPGPDGRQVRIVVMGVSGCGKSTVGALLAGTLGVPFADADDLHPAENVAKMSAGTPLTDDDRWPWLARVAARLAEGDGAVMACSALRRAYRDMIRLRVPNAIFVHLVGSRAQLGQRISARLNHFMPSSLLDSQFAVLERLGPDEAGVELDVAPPPHALARRAADLLPTLLP